MCIIMNLEILQLNSLDVLCQDVAIELPLQPLTGEKIVPATVYKQDDARIYMLVVSGGVPFLI